MKKSFISLGLIIVSAVALTNCTKEIDQHIPDNESGIPFELVVSTINTKTSTDGINTEWEDDDALNVFHAEKGSATYVDDGKFTLTTGDSFSGTLASDLTSEEYDWYVFYPYSNFNKSPAGANDDNFARQVLGYYANSSQIQEGNSNKSHLAGLSFPMYGKATVAKDDAVSVSMNHLMSVIEVVVVNNTATPLTVQEVQFVATEDVVGQYYINFVGNEVVYTPREGNVSSTAKLTVNDGTPIESTQSAKFYIGVKPFTAENGSELTISVNGYSKTIEMTKDVVFKPGNIKTVTMSYDKPEAETKTWSLVSNIGDIVDGEYAILATTDKVSYGYLPTTTTGSNPVFSSQDVLNPSTPTTSAMVDASMIWNVTVNNDGSLVFTNSNDDYLYTTGEPQGLRVGNTSYSWVVDVHPSDPNAFTLKSIAANRFVGVYNTDWRSYTTAVDKNYDVEIGETLYDGLKSQLYFFYCGTISQKTTLATPTNVVAEVVNTNQIRVTWDAVANAGGYEVSCGDKTVQVETTSHTFTELSYDTEYTISVVAEPEDRTLYYASAAATTNVTTGQLVGVSTYEWTLAEGDLGTSASPSTSVSKGTPSMTWTIAYSWEGNKSIGWDGNYERGVQIGTSSLKCNSLTLTTNDYGKVNSITIGAGTASSGNAQLSVTVGGVAMKINGSTSVKLNTSTTPTTYTFTSESQLEGDIVITITNSKTKALYLKSISINK